MPFTGLGLVQGAKLATVVLDAAIVALSYHLLRVRQVRGAPLWMLLFIGAGSLFFWRMGQCRPHLGSILFVLTGLHLMARRRPMVLALVAALYALAYTASHVILILAMLAAVLHRRSHGRIAFELPLAALVGLAAGHLLHPNFPHNLLIWKIQNVDFYRFAWLQGALDLGKEAHFLPRTLTVAKGDVVMLAVDARDGSHVCDLTDIDLTIAEIEKSEHGLQQMVAVGPAPYHV